MLKKILRKKRLILICFCITFCVYLILNSFKQQSAAESKKLREQEEYHQNQIFLEAQPYNPICELPQLQIINHENTLPKKECRLKENWGFVKENVWYFIDSIKRRLHYYECKYRPIYRVDDTKYTVGDWYELTNQQTIKHEVFEVICRDNGSFRRIKFDNLYVQLVSKLNSSSLNNIINISIDETSKIKCKPLNIMLISYDSVSRSSWLKRVPKSTKYAMDVMKFQILNGYNIVGDGTPAALIPIYAGRTEEELPSVLRNDPKGRYVDEAYPFIWKDLHTKKNFTSIHLDDWPHIGAFSYRMKGFLNHTTTHYYKHYQLRLWDRVAKYYYSKNSRNDDFCIGAIKRHKVLLDLILEFKRNYKNLSNNMVIMHYVENSHDTNERFNWVDDELYEFLSQGFTQNLFDNTAIFLFSDHGARFTDKRSSNNRYLEERLPFFAVYLPEIYKQQNVQKFNNLLLNSKKLTSPFDIYATVRDLTCLDDDQYHDDHEESMQRSVSLLRQISPERNCQHIGISEHYCTCLQKWKNQKLNDKLVIKAAEFSVASINQLTDPVRRMCVELSLKEIISAEVLKKSANLVYKIQLITKPNNGIYEALLYNRLMHGFEFKSTRFSISSRNEISRIDAYGEQPYCVADFASNPSYILDLRKFCFCKVIKKLKPWLIRKKF